MRLLKQLIILVMGLSFLLLVSCRSAPPELPPLPWEVEEELLPPEEEIAAPVEPEPEPEMKKVSESRQVRTTKPEWTPGEIVTLTEEWKQKSLREALQIIADKANVNIIPDLSITDEDTVTMNFNNLEWRKVLGKVASLTGCILEEESPNLFSITKPPLVTITFDKQPVEEAIRSIAQLANINIIISSDVKGTITIRLSKVPWMDALENIVKTAGFVLVKEKHNVIRVVLPETLTTRMETRLFQLKYLRPPSPITAYIKSPYAKGNPREIKDAIKEFTLLDILKNMLSRNKAGKIVGTLEYDYNTNTIIVKDTKPVLDELQRVIDRLDVQPQQVLLDVSFVNTRNEDLLEFGIRYGGGAGDGINTSTTPVPGTKTTRLPFGLGHEQTPTSQFFLTTWDLTATLRLFKKDMDSKLIQRPNILALDGRAATIFVGEEIYYAEISAQATQAGGLQYTIGEASKSPVKVGFQLLVIPHIIRGTNKVMMTVVPQDESLTGSNTETPVGFEHFEMQSGGGTQSIDLPRKRQSTLVTHMIVESGLTAVIGGLTIDRTSKEVHKVPFLGDIPLIRTFFRYTGDSIAKDHLLIFITPRILRNASESMKVLPKRGNIDEIERVIEEMERGAEESEK